jgi:tetratricopeptide (TPR) repeat protein
MGRVGRGLLYLAAIPVSALALAAALLLVPSDPRARDDRYLHALEAFDRGDFERALSILGPLDDDRSHRLAARAATASGRPLLAIDHLLRIDNRDYRDTLDLAAAYRAAGMADVALLTYESATRLNPDDPVPWKAAGLLYAERGDVALATSFLLRAYELDPDDKELLIQVADLGRPRHDRDRETFGGLGRMPASGVRLPEAPDPRRELRR